MLDLSRRQTVKILSGFGVGKYSQVLFNHNKTESQATNHTIYIGDDVGTMYAFDESGRIQWEFNVDPEEEDEEDSLRRIDTSPTVVDGTVYFGFTSGSFGGTSKFYAVSASTGEKQWEYSEPFDIESSPTVVNGTVYFGSDDDLVHALDADTGNVKWTYKTDSWVRSSPAVVNNRVFVGSWDTYLHAIDAQTGDRLWKAETGDRITNSPTVYRDSVYIGSDDGKLYSFDTKSGDCQWTFEGADTVWSSSTVYNESIYIGSSEGYLYSIDLSDGSEKWSISLGDSVNTPTVVDAIVYVGTNNGELYAIDSHNNEIIWEGPDGVSNDGFSTGAPTVFEEHIYLQAGATIMAVDRETGSLQWAETIGSAFAGGSDPTIVQDPETGDSVGSRVSLGSLGHHHTWAEEAAEKHDSGVDQHIFDTVDQSGDGDVSLGELQNAVEQWSGNQQIDGVEASLDDLREIVDWWAS